VINKVSFSEKAPVTRGKSIESIINAGLEVMIIPTVFFKTSFQALYYQLNT
jgi:hypothetical protein